MKMENELNLCGAEVKKNLVLAELGKPLTIPLAILNASCQFKKEWDRIQNIWHDSNTKEDILKAKRREYSQRPEVKAKQKAYQQRPEIKAKQKAYRRKYYLNNKKEVKNK